MKAQTNTIPNVLGVGWYERLIETFKLDCVSVLGTNSDILSAIGNYQTQESHWKSVSKTMIYIEKMKIGMFRPCPEYLLYSHVICFWGSLTWFTFMYSVRIITSNLPNWLWRLSSSLHSADLWTKTQPWASRSGDCGPLSETGLRVRNGTCAYWTGGPMVTSLIKAVVRGRKWSELCFETLRQSLSYLAKLKKEMRRSYEMHRVSRL